MKKLFILMCSLFLASGVYAAEYPSIDLKELKEAIQSGKVTLLDVNGTGSWQKGHIPGALDFQASKAKLASLLPTDKSALVVAYCGGPRCGAYAQAAAAAVKLGYTNVKHFTPGISGWKDAGEATEKGT